MNFPKIETIDDVLPFIYGNEEFIIADKGDYKVINYVVQTNDTFPEDQPILRECRGLTFYPDGRIMRRMFHKFFNLNERDETNIKNVDFSEEHFLLEKLDGSMIAPLVINGEIRWGTKMGLTDTAVFAENFVKQNPVYEQFAKAFTKINITPIFEFISRKNRIVLDYPEDKLILLAMRYNISGEYIPYKYVKSIAESYGIPVVNQFPIQGYDIDDIISKLKLMQNAEGIVVTFNDGLRLKVKTDWYIKIHKAKEVVTREYVLAELILQDKIDDVKPLLLQQDLDYVNSFQKDLLNKLRNFANNIHSFHKTKKELTRKDFSLNYLDISHLMKSIIFATWDKNDLNYCYDTVKNFFLKNVTHQKKYEIFKREYLNAI